MQDIEMATIRTSGETLVPVPTTSSLGSIEFQMTDHWAWPDQEGWNGWDEVGKQNNYLIRKLKLTSSIKLALPINA